MYTAMLKPDHLRHTKELQHVVAAKICAQESSTQFHFIHQIHGFSGVVDQEISLRSGTYRKKSPFKSVLATDELLTIQNQLYLKSMKVT